MEGKTLGRYRIVGKIGAGGMGEVWRARDESLDRDVALKILPDAMARDPERRKRFEREAKTVAAMQHPNIVTIHSIEEADGVHFLTMELVRGQTLDAILPDDGLPLDRIFAYGIPTADAIHAAHEQGVVHRDLKPGNVMIDDTGRVRVLDFGLAKPTGVAETGQETTLAKDDLATKEGQILGTVAYMSPEQAEGKPLDRRSDIFSLGIVLYEMATGQRPFRGSSPISTMSAILKEVPPSVTALKPLPRHLGRIIQRCLEKNPDKRFQTARDVCNELEGLKREVESGEVESVSGMSSSGAPVPAPSARIRPWQWIAGIAVLAVVATLLIYMLGPRRGGSERSDATLTQTRPLTSEAGVEYAGSWSPDESFFAYSHSANGPLDIFIRSAAGGDPVRLVTSPTDAWMPVWSPDNRYIAYIDAGRDDLVGIYLVPPLGGEPRFLASIGFELLDEEAAVTFGANPWSPDGRRLVYSRKEEGTVALWIIELATGVETRLTEPGADVMDGSPTWSFDGSRIAFVRSRIAFMRTSPPSTSLCTISPSGDDLRTVPTEIVFAGPIGWSPDGQEIIYVAAPQGGPRGIWAVDVTSGAQRRLTSGASDVSSATAGRAGTILYSDFSHQTDLYLQALDGGEARRLTFHTRSNFASRLSPDETRVVYQSDRTGNNEIWLLDLVSGKERQLTDADGDDRMPDWSTDGEDVVFVSDRTGQPRLWIVGVTSGSLRELLSRDGVMKPRWAPDGTAIGFLSFSDGGPSLWTVSPDGTAAEKRLDDVRDFAWYGDAGCVIYSPSSAPTEIRAVDLASGRETLLLDAPHIELAVDPTGRALTYCSAESHFNMNLQLLRLSEGDDGLPRAIGEPEPLTAGDGLWHVHNGGWSSDGRTVIYTRDTDTGDVYALEGAF
jgi:serine/threonine protein kinase/Tol biopolymer transport system component